MAAQLLLQHVKTPSGVCADILVDAGRIVRIAPDLPPSLADTRLDAEGHMAAPGFVNAHIHPAQTFVGGPWVDYDYADTVPGRAKAEAEYLAKHGRMNSLRNCYVQFREAIRRGTTHVRGHIDVGVFGLAELEDAARAREAFRDVLDIEYVAMPSNGILNMKTDPEQTIAAALRAGASSIGGADPCDRDRDPVRSVELTLRLAAEHGAKVDLHLHEFGSMGLFSLDLLFKKIREYDLRDRVTISHAWCLANLPDTRYQPIAEAFQELGIGIITHVPGHVPFPSLKQARRWQVRYGVGTDNMRNLWGPYGMNDMRERVMLLAYLIDVPDAVYADGTVRLWNAVALSNPCDQPWAAQTIIHETGHVLGLPDYGLSEGCWADLVVFPVENRACALLEGPMPRFVIKRGVLVARDGELTDAVPPCPE